jgi:hypothetical protein
MPLSLDMLAPQLQHHCSCVAQISEFVADEGRWTLRSLVFCAQCCGHDDCVLLSSNPSGKADAPWVPNTTLDTKDRWLPDCRSGDLSTYWPSEALKFFKRDPWQNERYFDWLSRMPKEIDTIGKKYFMTIAVFKYIHRLPDGNARPLTQISFASWMGEGDVRQAVAFQDHYTQEWTRWHGYWWAGIERRDALRPPFVHQGHFIHAGYKFNGNAEQLVEHHFRRIFTGTNELIFLAEKIERGVQHWVEICFHYLQRVPITWMDI